MPKRELDGALLQGHGTQIAKSLPALATAKKARPARRTRQIVTLEAVNAASAPAPDFDSLDFAMLDEPREPEKWY